MRATGPLGVRRPPSGSTIRRILTVVCPGGLADLLGCDPAGAAQLAVDGKCARGSRTDAAPAAHLLSAVMVGGRTVSQLRVPDKTTEVTGFSRLPAPFDLTGVVVTADALHTHRDHARWLVENKAHYVLVVKRNQPSLHDALRRLPWKQVTARDCQREAGHHVRKTTFGEDASKIRTGHGPANMATLRTAGHRSIAAGLREVSYQPFTRPLDLIDLH